MLNKEIKEKMMHDLGINEHRARAYAKMFADKFGGNVRAITYILASYTPNGDIYVSYVIENKRYHLTVNGNKPYSKKGRRAMKAIGKDGQWHDWDELSAEEQSEWIESMTEADNICEYRKSHDCAPTLKQNIARYEQNKSFIY